MRKFLIVSALTLATCLPVAAHAQQQSKPPPPAHEAMGHHAGFDGHKMLAIGVGVVAGAVIVGSTIGMRTATILGGVAGGLLANWWYNEHMSAPALALTKKAP